MFQRREECSGSVFPLWISVEAVTGGTLSGWGVIGAWWFVIGGCLVAPPSARMNPISAKSISLIMSLGGPKSKSWRWIGTGFQREASHCTKGPSPSWALPCVHPELPDLRDPDQLNYGRVWMASQPSEHDNWP